MAAALTLGDTSPALQKTGAPLLPPLNEARSISRQIAIAVGLEAQNQGVAKPATRDEVEQRIDQIIWTPQYHTMKKA